MQQSRHQEAPPSVFHLPSFLLNIFKPFMSDSLNPEDLHNFMLSLPPLQYVFSYTALIHGIYSDNAMLLSQHWTNVHRYFLECHKRLNEIQSASYTDTETSPSIQKIAYQFCDMFFLDSNSTPRSNAFLLSQLLGAFQKHRTFADTYDQLLAGTEPSSANKSSAMLLALLHQLQIIQPITTDNIELIKQYLQENPYKALLSTLGHPPDNLDDNASFVKELLQTNETTDRPNESSYPDNSHNQDQSNAHIIFAIHFLLNLDTIHNQLINHYELSKKTEILAKYIKNWHTRTLPIATRDLTLPQNTDTAFTSPITLPSIWKLLNSIRTTYYFHKQLQEHDANVPTVNLYALVTSHFLKQEHDAELIEEISKKPPHEQLITLACYYFTKSNHPTTTIDPNQSYSIALNLLNTPPQQQDDVRTLFTKISETSTGSSDISYFSNIKINNLLSFIGRIIYRTSETTSSTLHDIKNYFADSPAATRLITNCESIYHIFQTQKNRIQLLHNKILMMSFIFIIALTAMGLTQLYIAGITFTASTIALAFLAGTSILTCTCYIGFQIAEYFSPIKNIWQIPSPAPLSQPLLPSMKKNTTDVTSDDSAKTRVQHCV